MHSLLPLLTAAALAGHALFGCCWHERAGQGHKADCAACQQDRGTASSCCDSTGEEPSLPCSCRLECQKLCQYVSPERTQSVGEAGLVSFGAILPQIAACAGCPRPREGHPSVWGDPRRILLEHQILLI
jgi:hypothetical protein